jgi:hypothetical protein
MADEINRASPRTQSALLQAMQEHHVTVAGQRYDLPRPFHVLATQNPIEQEGTYPLPEAQLDRFLLEIDVPYPDLEAERRMLFATTGGEEAEPRPVFTPSELMAAQRLVRMIPVGDSVAEAILKLVRFARPGPDADAFVSTNIAWGPGPARQPGADARRTCPRPARRAAEPVDRRRDGAGQSDAAAPHGDQLHRPRRRTDARRRHRPADRNHRMTGMTASASPTSVPGPAHPDAFRLRRRAESLASALPPMLVAAERIANALIHGLHGRRRSGPGEDFWQYRSYSFGDSVQSIDWRKSSRSDRVLVRENEWAASHTVWLWASQGAGHGVPLPPGRNDQARPRGAFGAGAVGSGDQGRRAGRRARKPASARPYQRDTQSHGSVVRL